MSAAASPVRRTLYVRLSRPDIIVALDEEARRRRWSRAQLVEAILLGEVPWPPPAQAQRRAAR